MLFFFGYCSWLSPLLTHRHRTPHTKRKRTLSENALCQYSFTLPVYTVRIEPLKIIRFCVCLYLLFWIVGHKCYTLSDPCMNRSFTYTHTHRRSFTTIMIFFCSQIHSNFNSHSLWNDTVVAVIEIFFFLIFDLSESAYNNLYIRVFTY